MRKLLYVALSNADAVAEVSTEKGDHFISLDTTVRNQQYAGTYPNALAQSRDGKRLFVADASSNAIAVFDTSNVQPIADPHAVPDASKLLPTLDPHEAAAAGAVLRLMPLGFIPTDWYPSALAVQGDDLLIATAKGQGTRPNKARARLPGKSGTTSIPTFPRCCAARSRA